MAGMTILSRRYYMIKFSPKSNDDSIRVVVVANYELVRDSLKALIDSNREMSVVARVSYDEDLSKPDPVLEANVAVLYYSPGDRIEIIADLIEVLPDVRVVLVVDRADLDSQAKAIKFGAVGIVHKEQSHKMLVEAIRQTHKGDTWLNQVILNKILVGQRSGKDSSLNAIAAKNPDALTPRELEVTRLIGVGLKNKEIAQRLSITEATVRHHLSSIYGKVGVDDRLNLAIFAHHAGIIKLTRESVKGSLEDGKKL
jgi:DNA-binding NarL/FixJ family response regulator